MQKALKIIVATIIMTIIPVGLLVTFLVVNARHDAKIREQDQILMEKPDDELLGERISIKREGKDEVDVNFYRGDGDCLPLVVNLHGGAYIAGDADTLDTQSDRISRDWGVNVASVDYALLEGDVTKEYVVEEITDAVRYFLENKEEYHIDDGNVFLMGYSAGGYYAAASTLALYRAGIDVKGQILCYAFVGDMRDTFSGVVPVGEDANADADTQAGGSASETDGGEEATEDSEANAGASAEAGSSASRTGGGAETDSGEDTDAAGDADLPKTLFVVIEGDGVSQASLSYEKLLAGVGAPTETITYGSVKHGFLEENNPEYEQLSDKNKTSRSAEAEKIMLDAEGDIGEWLHKAMGETS